MSSIALHALDLLQLNSRADAAAVGRAQLLGGLLRHLCPRQGVTSSAAAAAAVMAAMQWHHKQPLALTLAGVKAAWVACALLTYLLPMLLVLYLLTLFPCMPLAGEVLRMAQTGKVGAGQLAHSRICRELGVSMHLSPAAVRWLSAEDAAQVATDYAVYTAVVGAAVAAAVIMSQDALAIAVLSGDSKPQVQRTLLAPPATSSDVDGFKGGGWGRQQHQHKRLSAPTAPSLAPGTGVCTNHLCCILRRVSDQLAAGLGRQKGVQTPA